MFFSEPQTIIIFNESCLGTVKLSCAGAFACVIKALMCGTSLVVQWLRLHVSTAGGVDSIPFLGTKIPHAT